MGAGRQAELQVGIAGVDVDSGTGLPVRPVSAVGALSRMTMNAAASAAVPVDTEILSSTQGWKVIEIRAVTAIAAGQSVIIGYSMDASDAAVPTNLGLAVTSWGTPIATEYPNQDELTNTQTVAVIPWDGTTTIKTLASMHTANSAVKLAVKVVA